MIKTILIYACIMYLYREWVIVVLGFFQFLTSVALDSSKKTLELRTEESRLLKENNNLLFMCCEKLKKSAGLSRSARIKTVKEVEELCK